MLLQRDRMMKAFRLLVSRQFKRRRHPHNPCDILRAAATFAFLRSAPDKRRKLDPSPNKKKTDAFRSVELMRTGGDHIHIQLRNINIQNPDRLYSVGVKRDVSIAANRGDFPDR